MSVEFNDKEMKIEVKECLDFGYVKEFVMNEIYDEFEYYEQDNIQEFIHHELTEDDKKNIMYAILDNFQSEEAKASYYGGNVSIFDEDIIRKGIANWIFDKFEFSIES